jgi:alcohol dehydrogenase class IV
VVESNISQITGEIMRFEFSTAARIIFGNGTLAEVPDIVVEHGSHVFLVTGHSVALEEQFIESLQSKDLRITLHRIQGEPTVSMIEKGTALVKENNCDLVIGFGGGSVLDAGKAIAALARNPGEILDYLEVIGRGRPLDFPPLPYIAIPTTSGTGSEVTRNAVIGSIDHKVKVSLRSPQMIPQIAVIDPELTYSVPPDVTANTGLDALTQLIEPFVSNSPSPITDNLCRVGMQMVSRSLLRAHTDGKDRLAREDMSLASLFSGLALANAGLGAVHGFAGPIGGLFSAPHGAICAALLPQVVKRNIEALRRGPENGSYLKRYLEIAKILTDAPNANIEDGVTWLYNLVQKLNVPSLSTYGITMNEFSVIIEKAKYSSSMRWNPVELSEEDMRIILYNSL